MACRTLAMVTALLAIIGCSSKPQYVRATRDIEVPSDQVFPSEGRPSWKGRIERGSLCIERLRKGSIVYVECPLAVDSSIVEPVRE